MIFKIRQAIAVDIGPAFKLGTESIEGKAGYGSIGEFVSAILPNIYVIAGIILFFLFIGGGFAILASGDNPDQKGNGAKAVTGAIVGFIIIFASYWIIQIIEKLTGVKIFNPGDI
ncbi:hypothetical protein ACFLZ1_00405 [Patescibacteria group bacterium]